MSDNEKGLYNKYIVLHRNDLTPVYSCFVLEPEKDPAAVAALRAYAAATEKKALAQDIYDWVGRAADENPPLTLDELRGMYGQPIWIQGNDLKHSGWAIVGATFDDFDKQVAYCPDCLNVSYYMKDYGKTWVAYRRKPKEEVKG